MAVDWLAIKNDYINGLGSYRKLAEIHGVSFNTLQDRAKREDWTGQKQALHDRIAAETRQKIAAAVSDQEADRVTKLLAISDSLITRIEKAVQELDMAQVTNKTKMKVIEYNNPERADKPTKEIISEKEEILAVHSIIDRKGLQQVATAIKAVWDVAAGEKEETGKKNNLIEAIRNTEEIDTDDLPEVE